MSDKNQVANSPQMVKAVISYKSQREKIKTRQRRELEDELFQWKADVGDEILRARDEGKSIATIASIIGIQNRTFIYEMMSAANTRNGGEKPEPAPEDEFEGDPDNPDADYLLRFYDGQVEVTFPDGDEYTLSIIDGRPDLPDEWADHTKARRDLYKQIIKDITEHESS